MDKHEFNKKFRDKTKRIATDVIKLCKVIKYDQISRVITFQIVKSATSTAANYRAACRARSDKEFFSKMSITVEEADETLLWLEIMEECDIANKVEVQRLHTEMLEVVKVCSKARKSMSTNNEK